MTLEKPRTTVRTFLPVPRASALLPIHIAGWIAGTFLLAAGLLLPAGRASAEPYMAVREGYKCSQCHVNKTGGGARTDYANVYLQTRLAAHPGFGSGEAETDLGTGRVANSLSVGADLRAALTYGKFKGQSASTTFGQETACYSCHVRDPNGAGEAAGGKVAEAYLRYQPIPGVVSIVSSVTAIPGLASRDFYGLVETVIPGNGYVKAGTFKLPNGLNNTWDTPFQHVTQGGYGDSNHVAYIGFETVYATGVEMGFEPGPFSFSLSATNPESPVTTSASGGSNQTDKRYFFTASAVGRIGLIGVNYATDPEPLMSAAGTLVSGTRTLESGFIGTSLGRVTVLGQFDQLSDTAKGTATVNQQAALGEVDLLLVRGHNLKYMIEARNPDQSISRNLRNRQSLIYDTFLTPFLQLRLGYRKYEGPMNSQPQPPSGYAIQGDQYFGEAHFIF